MPGALSRRKSIRAGCLVLLTAVLSGPPGHRAASAGSPLAEGPSGTSLEDTGRGDGARADIPRDWWSQVRRSIHLAEYAVEDEGAIGSGFRVVNRAHRFGGRVDSRGLRLAATEGTSWTWGLSLTGWGRPGALDAAAVTRLSADANRVDLERGGALTEWFVNGPGGLEHGFTVLSRPRAAGDRLAFDLALAGGLRPVFAADRQAVDFFDSGNVSVLRYAKLVVIDAAGDVLPARMDPIPGGIRILVEDGDAVYPITVDPLATNPSWTAVSETDSSKDERFGTSVSTAGDVNGDGYSDVIVGAWASEGNAGRAFLYLGGAGGLATAPSWITQGEASANRFGISVATAGDVNGDGYSDVLVGANGYGNFNGKAYLYLGGTSGLEATPSWTAVGTAEWFGYSVATAGDVNGDGYSDVIVGAYVHNNFNGKAYLYLGGATGLAASPAWTAVGTAEWFGHSVATAGDVNGDGHADVIVGALASNNSRGKAYLYLGGTSGLATSPSWTTFGEAAEHRFGGSVATAGDVNGDGYADVIVGAFGHDGFRGKTYLYLGGASGLAASPSWTGAGEFLGDNFGVSVATAGDVNGDGYSDVVVGANGHSGSRGKSYLYVGEPGSAGLGTGAAWTALGEGAAQDGADQFGYSVATGGDVNGDGYSDLLVGAWRYAGVVNVFNAFLRSNGKAYLYLGGAGGPATGEAWTGAGEAAGDRFGFTVASAGDVNGDGYSDVIVGAYNNAGVTGKTYLYLGGSSGLAMSDAWTAVGEAAGDEFGASLARAGDVNGDGYSDVIVGARGHNGDAGKAYLYLGGASGLAANASWTAVGEVAGDGFGFTVATAGDVNGDGYSDVIVGISNIQGKAYLYLGGAGGLSASPFWTAASSNGFGSSASTAGDVNGDGYSDVIIGAPGTTGPGEAFVYLGGANGLASSPSWMAAGEAAGDRFGSSVATAGDVNGDGYADVIVGAYASAGSTGKAYLYPGGASGPAASPSWTAAGAAANDVFGLSVATAGDVSGDGYSDVIVGAYGDASFAGKAYLYMGGATGLATSASWTAVGEAAFDLFGYSVATAGDVNGDGYTDLIVGANGNTGVRGKTYLYSGGGGAGVPMVPGQWRTDLSAPIPLGGPAFGQLFRLGLTLRSPTGPVKRKLQWQLAPWGGGFSPASNPIQSDPDWHAAPVTITNLVSLPQDSQRYLWRARIKYHPADSPFLPQGPWVTPGGNGLYEADLLSTSLPQPVCVGPPAQALFITMMTLDGNGKPVIHYQDPNPPADVTGANVYRAAAPTGPWVVLGLNAADMDAGAPDIQYVDQSGGIGSPWFYQVAAWDNACGAEGPW